ncbi:MAG: GvpL/GvpF family gas vesicle protein [Deltaproteobacteria bacterium]|nr:GvpL/GvpF family gas vesicle protein [Deltaproteobacteria bacterium]
MGEGTYLYCIIGTDEARNFGANGIGGRNDTVTTLSYDGISAVISRSPLAEYPLTRDNLLAHQLVIEGVMEDYTVLPVRFSTIAESAEDIRSVLRKRCAEFKGLLRDMEGHVELGLKAMWKDLPAVFSDIAGTDTRIKRLKERLDDKAAGKVYNEKIELGRLVEAALGEKKRNESERILSSTRPLAVDIRENRLHGDNMILNAAFLVREARIKEFDRAVKEIDAGYGGGVKLKYVGPVPPFNFVNIIIEWK